VRAADQSDIPLISAVGHETDWTLLDLVADERAPTPTGAAEMSVPVKADLEASLSNLSARLRSASSRNIDQRRQNFIALSRGLPSLDNLLALPRRRIDEATSNLAKAIHLNTINKRRGFDLAVNRLTPIALLAALRDRHSNVQQIGQRLNTNFERISDRKRTSLERLIRTLQPVPLQILRKIGQNRSQIDQYTTRNDNAVASLFRRLSQQLQAQDRMMQSLAYTNVLKRGFALVRDGDNKPITLASGVSDCQALNIQFADGYVNANAAGEGISNDMSTGKPIEDKPAKLVKKMSKPKTPSKDQGSLF
jgi:exodeoxyribonuclease VII large subunit